VLRTIRKTTPVFFLIIFFLPVTSTYFLFKIRQSAIHRTIRELINHITLEKKLLVLKIPLNTEQEGVIFERTDKMEFRYKGKMYDVARAEKHNNVTWYWCVWDKEETALEENLKEVKGKVMGTAADSERNEETLSLFLNTLFLNTNVPKNDLSVKDLKKTNYYWQSCSVTRPITPPTPPPEV
jgi:hypothetical protein